MSKPGKWRRQKQARQIALWRQKLEPIGFVFGNGYPEELNYDLYFNPPGVAYSINLKLSVDGRLLMFRESFSHDNPLEIGQYAMAVVPGFVSDDLAAIDAHLQNLAAKVSSAESQSYGLTAWWLYHHNYNHAVNRQVHDYSYEECLRIVTATGGDYDLFLRFVGYHLPIAELSGDGVLSLKIELYSPVS